MILPLVEVESVSVDWRLSCIYRPLRTSLPTIPCALRFRLKDGTVLANQVPFYLEPPSDVIAHQFAKTNGWLPGKIINSGQEAVMLNDEGKLFITAHQLITAGYEMTQDDSQLREFETFIKAPYNLETLESIPRTAHWKSVFEKPISVKLPGLSLGVLFANRVWSKSTDLNDDEALALMMAMSDAAPSLLLKLCTEAGQQLFLRVIREANAVNDSERTQTTRRVIREEVRHEVWRRDQGQCVRCGSRERLEFDHIVPFSKGGSDTARNIELLCENCNRSKGARI